MRSRRPARRLSATSWEYIGTLVADRWINVRTRFRKFVGAKGRQATTFMAMVDRGVEPKSQNKLNHVG